MKSKRNRIVIDLDKARADQQGRIRARRSGRAGRILAVIAIVLVLMIIGVVAGGFFWWQHYKAQPSYTLALLVDAAQRNDKQEIDRLLDMDKIAENFVTDVRSHVTGSSVLNSVLPAQLDQIVATITPKLKETLHDVLPEEIRRVTEPAKGKPFILIAMSVPYFANIRQDGATATADFKFKDEQIQLTMHQGTGSWRIVSIRDDRLAGIIADAAKKGLSQRGSQLKDEVERQLKNLNLPTASP
jgi:flagellar basal body-associated protein FliL